MGLLTVAKCYGFLWSANPCRLVYAHWDRKLPRELVRRFFLISSSPSSLRRPWKGDGTLFLVGTSCPGWCACMLGGFCASLTTGAAF